MVVTDGFAKVTTIKHHTSSSEPFVSSRMPQSTNCESGNYSVELDDTLRKHLNQFNNSSNLEKYNLNKNDRLLLTTYDNNDENHEELRECKKLHATNNNKHFVSELHRLTVQPLPFEHFSQGKVM